MAIPIYEEQYREYNAPEARLRPAGDANAYGAGVWGAIDKFSLAAKAKIEEFEDAETLEMANRFQRDIDDYHLDPNKGALTTRKGKDAIGLADEAAGFMKSRMDEYGGQLRSQRAKANFYKLAIRAADSQHNKNMTYEAKNVDDYKMAEIKARVDYNVDAIGRDPTNDQLAADLENEIMQALELKWRNNGVGEDAIKAEVADIRNRIGATRFVGMFTDDPAMAEAWYNDNKDMFNAPTKLKIEEEIMKWQARGIANAILQQYGDRYDLYDGQQAIRAMGLSPAQEDAAISAYSSLWGQRARGYALREAEINKAQSDLNEKITLDYALDKMWSDEDIMNANLSDAQKARWISLNKKFAEYGAAMRELKATPGSENWTQAMYDEAYMNSRGTTEEQHSTAFGYVADLIGNAKPAQIKALTKQYLAQGLITTADKTRLDAAADDFAAQQKAMDKPNKSIRIEMLNQEIARFKRYMNPGVNTIGVRLGDNERGKYPAWKAFSDDDYISALNELNIYKLQLSGNGIIPDDALALMKEKVMEQMSILVDKARSFSAQNDTDTRGWFNDSPTAYAQGMTEFRHQLENELTGNPSFPPGLAPRRPDIEPVEYTQGSKPLDYINSHGARMLGNGFSVPSMGVFNSTRDRKDRQGRPYKGSHYGYDYSIKEGAGIKFDPMIRGNFTVQEVGARGGYGNSVLIAGRDSLGNDVQIRYSHLSAFPAGLKAGDAVTGGTIIGYVGHTGSTSRDIEKGGKRTGDHVDEKLWVKGKNGKFEYYDMASYIQQMEIQNRHAGDAMPEILPSYGQEEAEPEPTIDQITDGMSQDELFEFILKRYFGGAR